MRFEVEGVEYRVRFTHTEFCPPQVNPDNPKHVYKFRTDCVLEEGLFIYEPELGPWASLARASSRCSILDQFCKRRGREISFGSALKSLNWPQEKRKKFIKALRDAELNGGKGKSNGMSRTGM